MWDFFAESLLYPEFSGYKAGLMCVFAKKALNAGPLLEDYRVYAPFYRHFSLSLRATPNAVELRKGLKKKAY